MRKRREIKSGATYKILATANRNETIFSSKNLRQIIIKKIKLAQKKYHFILYKYCILNHQLFLIIKPNSFFSISKIMQWILSSFAICYNKINNLKGHVWYDRFKSWLIDNFFDFLESIQQSSPKFQKDNFKGYNINYGIFFSWRNMPLLDYS